MDTGEFHRVVLAFLKRWRTASLATVDVEGLPCNANVQYVCDDDLNLIFVSSSRSQHALNIAAEPRVAVTIYAHIDDDASPAPSEIHGLQLQGDCIELSGTAEREEALERFAARFPFVAESPLIAERIKKESFYRISPYWMRYIDNRRGFGWKMEVEM